MDKKLIGWTIVVALEDNQFIRTYYSFDQEEWMTQEFDLRVKQGAKFSVEPEFGKV